MSRQTTFDALAKESLKTALEEFEGTVLLVSHEEAFYREWTQKVINMEKKIAGAGEWMSDIAKELAAFSDKK